MKTFYRLLTVFILLVVVGLHTVHDPRRHDAAVGMFQQELIESHGSLNVVADGEIFGLRFAPVRLPLAGDAHAFERHRHVWTDTLPAETGNQTLGDAGANICSRT